MKNFEFSEEIEVSIIATAHRPKNWEVVYRSIVTDLKFEVIFVGTKELPRNINLPGNFRFMKSKVKPTQCVEIAIRKGGKLFVSEAYVDEKVGLRRGSTLGGDYWESDRKYLNSLWTIDGKVIENRIKSVAGFKEIDIKLKTQGPRGHWAGRTSAGDYLDDLVFWRRKLGEKIVSTKLGQTMIKFLRLRQIRRTYRKYVK